MEYTSLDDYRSPHPAALRFAEREQSRSIIQRILVVIDPVASAHPGIEKAIRIASSCGSSVELYACEVETDLPGSWTGLNRAGEYRALLRGRRREELETLAASLRSRGIRVTTVSGWDDPPDTGVGEHVIRTRPDLVVKTRRRAAPAHHGDTATDDWSLIRQIDAPLLLVGGAAWRQRPVIAAAVDPCRPAERPISLDEALFAKACSMAAALRGQVDLLHVLERLPHLPGEPVSAKAQSESDLKARAAVQSLIRPQCSVVTEVRFREGRVPQTLVDLTLELAPDMLLIGTAARDRYPHTDAGTTACRILEQVACDVLIVKPPGFVSPLLVRSA